MKTYLRNRAALALAMIASFIVVVGCSPSRKQYAINEALLIDQTRLLENEVYRTRYELQKVLEENSRLKNELNGGPRLEVRRESSEDRSPRSRTGSVPFEQRPLQKSPPTRDSKKILVIPQSQYESRTPGNSIADSEILPRSVVDSGRETTTQVLPVSRPSSSLTRLPGPHDYRPDDKQNQVQQPQKIIVVPENQETKSETLPPAVIQPIPKSAKAQVGIRQWSPVE